MEKAKIIKVGSISVYVQCPYCDVDDWIAIDPYKMKRVVEQAHYQERKVRFWGTDVPDLAGQEYVWDLLLEAGVDFINTDKLKAFSEYIFRQGIKE